MPRKEGGGAVHMGELRQILGIKWGRSFYQKGKDQSGGGKQPLKIHIYSGSNVGTRGGHWLGDIGRGDKRKGECLYNKVNIMWL